jgi:hypothetical protein
MMSNKTFAGLLREFHVEVIDNAHNRSRSARQTCAGKTLENIFRLRGYDHLRSVIMTMVETRPNKRALIAPVIWAVSDVLNAYPQWFGDSWFRVMDGIDLAQMFERASANRSIALPRSAIATLIFSRMHEQFPDNVRVRGQRKSGGLMRPPDQPPQQISAFGVKTEDICSH